MVSDATQLYLRLHDLLVLRGIERESTHDLTMAIIRLILDDGWHRHETCQPPNSATDNPPVTPPTP